MSSTLSHPPSANRFLLHIFHLQPQHSLLVQQVIAACTVMGISANNARVALARLCRSGLLVLVDRGCYALSPKALLQKANPAVFDVTNLDDNPSPVCLSLQDQDVLLNALLGWRGDYFMVYASPVSSHKSWLSTIGFRQLEPYLFVRPNTLSWTVSHLESQAKLESKACVDRLFLVSELDAKTTKNIRQLYSIKRLEQGYRHCIKALEKSNKMLLESLNGIKDSVPNDKILRECYVLLERCDVLIQQDPCLPAQWLDSGLLAQCLKLRFELHEKVRRLWASRLMAC